MKPFPTLLAAVFTLTLVFPSVAQTNPHRELDNRLQMIELESLMEVYGEVFREKETMRVHRVRLEAERGEGANEDLQREARRMERAIHMLEQRLEELRREMHGRADRLQEQQRRRPEEMERRKRVEREEMETMRREREEREKMEWDRGQRERREERDAAMHEESDGEEEELEHEIPVSEVPERVMDAARRAAPGIEFAEAEIQITRHGAFYELEGEKDGMEVEVIVSADGRWVEVEFEDEDDGRE